MWWLYRSSRVVASVVLTNGLSGTDCPISIYRGALTGNVTSNFLMKIIFIFVPLDPDPRHDIVMHGVIEVCFIMNSTCLLVILLTLLINTANFQ